MKDDYPHLAKACEEAIKLGKSILAEYAKYGGPKYWK